MYVQIYAGLAYSCLLFFYIWLLFVTEPTAFIRGGVAVRRHAAIADNKRWLRVTTPTVDAVTNNLVCCCCLVDGLGMCGRFFAQHKVVGLLNKARDRVRPSLLDFLYFGDPGLGGDCYCC